MHEEAWLFQPYQQHQCLSNIRGSLIEFLVDGIKYMNSLNFLATAFSTGILMEINIEFGKVNESPDEVFIILISRAFF